MSPHPEGAFDLGQEGGAAGGGGVVHVVVGEVLDLAADAHHGAERAGDDLAGRVADQDFHSALLEASANPFLQTLTTSVSAAVSWTTVFKQRKEPLRRDPIPDHRRVYDAIADGDVEAAHREMMRLVDMAFLDTTKASDVERQAG